MGQRLSTGPRSPFEHEVQPFVNVPDAAMYGLWRELCARRLVPCGEEQSEYLAPEGWGALLQDVWRKYCGSAALFRRSPIKPTRDGDGGGSSSTGNRPAVPSATPLPPAWTGAAAIEALIATVAVRPALALAPAGFLRSARAKQRRRSLATDDPSAGAPSSAHGVAVSLAVLSALPLPDKMRFIFRAHASMHAATRAAARRERERAGAARRTVLAPTLLPPLAANVPVATLEREGQTEMPLRLALHVVALALASLFRSLGVRVASVAAELPTPASDACVAQRTAAAVRKLARALLAPAASALLTRGRVTYAPEREDRERLDTSAPGAALAAAPYRPVTSPEKWQRQRRLLQREPLAEGTEWETEAQEHRSGAERGEEEDDEDDEDDEDWFWLRVVDEEFSNDPLCAQLELTGGGRLERALGCAIGDGDFVRATRGAGVVGAALRLARACRDEQVREERDCAHAVFCARLVQRTVRTFRSRRLHNLAAAEAKRLQEAREMAGLLKVQTWCRRRINRFRAARRLKATLRVAQYVQCHWRGARGRQAARARALKAARADALRLAAEKQLALDAFNEAAGVSLGRLLLLIRPEAVAHTHEIVEAVHGAGFRILHVRSITEGSPTRAGAWVWRDPETSAEGGGGWASEEAAAFAAERYACKASSHFVKEVAALTRAPGVVALMLEHERFEITPAVLRAAELVGPANPGTARREAPASLCARFGGEGPWQLGVCASDSQGSARRQLALLFHEQFTREMEEAGGGGGAEAAVAWAAEQRRRASQHVLDDLAAKAAAEAAAEASAIGVFGDDSEFGSDEEATATEAAEMAAEAAELEEELTAEADSAARAADMEQARRQLARKRSAAAAEAAAAAAMKAAAATEAAAVAEVARVCELVMVDLVEVVAALDSRRRGDAHKLHHHHHTELVVVGAAEMARVAVLDERVTQLEDELVAVFRASMQAVEAVAEGGIGATAGASAEVAGKAAGETPADEIPAMDAAPAAHLAGAAAVRARLLEARRERAQLVVEVEVSDDEGDDDEEERESGEKAGEGTGPGATAAEREAAADALEDGVLLEDAVEEARAAEAAMYYARSQTARREAAAAAARAERLAVAEGAVEVWASADSTAQAQARELWRAHFVRVVRGAAAAAAAAATAAERSVLHAEEIFKEMEIQAEIARIAAADAARLAADNADEDAFENLSLAERLALAREGDSEEEDASFNY